MDQKNNNRMVMLLIAGIPVIMILAATWLWYFVVRGDLDLIGVLGTANRGALVQPPRQVDELALRDGDGLALRYHDLEPRWTMLVPSSGARCDEACEHSLYLTRQIHVAMGKGFNRLRRIYVSDTAPGETGLGLAVLSDGRPAPDSLADYLAAEHRGLKTLLVEPDVYGTLFPEQAVDPETWYLVDPGGWIMMSYDSTVPYKDVISDLKFLLKNSSE